VDGGQKTHSDAHRGDASKERRQFAQKIKPSGCTPSQMVRPWPAPFHTVNPRWWPTPTARIVPASTIATASLEGYFINNRDQKLPSW